MGSIYTIKELETPETPLLLFECEVGGTVERWSTHGVTVDGAPYAARVMAHNLFDLRASADDGVDSISRLSLALANADSHFSQIERNSGWKGARLTLRFVFYNLKTDAAASESSVLFRGAADAPEEISESIFRISFTNRLGLQRMLVPEVRIQKRCPWMFPETAEQRIEATSGGALGQYSRYFRCGYSAGEAGGAGNLNGAVPFTSCDYTRAQCEERGMFRIDSASNPTRRFGGVEFVPASILVRSYGERGFHVASPTENTARYNDFVPIVYGTAWMQPPIIFARNDGNLTHMEVLIGMGEIAGVEKIIVNDVEIPLGASGVNMTATGWFNIVSLGNRTGDFNLDFADGSGQPLGDPYGSMAVLSVVTPNQISDGRALPRVEALVTGMKLSRYDAEGVSLGEEFSNNPAWVLLDLLRRSGWELGEIDLASFAATAAYCAELVEALDLHGNTISIPRYQCNLVLRRRRSVADVVRGVRNASSLYLTYGAGGKLQIRPEGTIEVQQPAKPEGSNSETPMDGGWPAYEFGDGSDGFSSILRRASGEPAIRMFSRSTADSPNRYAVEFQDAFNEYQQDSASLLDADDVIRAGQQISTSLSALGMPNFDQALRVLRLQLNKSVQGNTYVEFETSMRSIGVKPGDIITLTYLKEGLERQPFRVTKISPRTNYCTALITAQIHDDAWYSPDGTGGPAGRRQRAHEIGLPRPLVGTLFDVNGQQQFGITEEATTGSDGSALVALIVEFTAPAEPRSVGVGIPLVSLSASISSTGGTLAGGQTLYYAVSAQSDGAESALSFLVRASIPFGTNTNTVTLQGLSFSAGTSEFTVYRGTNPQQVLRIASGVTVAGDYTDTGAAAQLAGPPDANFDHSNFHWRLELQPESAANIHGATTIGHSSLTMTANEFRGMAARITRGKGAGQDRAIMANSVTTLTVSTAWDVEPDATSFFTVAESSWRFGAMSRTSPARFDVPNREGATVHVSGRAANSHDEENPWELSPLTRWQISGAAGSTLDTDVAGEPTFGLFTGGRGQVELGGIGFADLTNTRSIAGGTLTLFYWDEIGSPSTILLDAAVSDTDDSIDLSAAGAASVGDLIQIGAEVLAVDEVLAGGFTYQVTRGSHGSTATAHAVDAPVYHLIQKVVIVPFVRDFFGSPASGSFSYVIALRNARIAAGELFVTNARGNSPTVKLNFTATVDEGLRTLSGGEISLQVTGYLAIQSVATAALVIDEDRSVRDIFAIVGEAPAEDPIELRLKQDGVTYCDLTIDAGETASNTVNGFGLARLAEGAELTLDILSAPQAPAPTPGRDLTVTIRL